MVGEKRRTERGIIMHLTDRNVQELAYAYNTNVLLSDEQVEWKRHMVLMRN